MLVAAYAGHKIQETTVSLIIKVCYMRRPICKLGRASRILYSTSHSEHGVHVWDMHHVCGDYISSAKKKKDCVPNHEPMKQVTCNIVI